LNPGAHRVRANLQSKFMHVKHGLLLAVICYLAPTLPSQANDMLPFDTVRQQFRTTQDLTLREKG